MKNRKSNRLRGYNYSSDNLYFITICVHNRTGRDLSLQPKIKSLSELIGAYKTTVSKMIHMNGDACFSWQRSFFDRVIRDKKSSDHISDYILDNPARWEQDRFNKRYV